ncbi:YtcA family lipoprotein [Paraburkholderia sp. SIMBA_030]|uniref:YtcA family lipoprotein n=1 Tax=Paraburkholderia sp. SIMBA_030 TaxID=3085773 RepID=UPI00397A19E1
MTSPGVSFIASLPLGGCSGTPSIGVFGAFFPDWLFCTAAGVVGTLSVHRVVSKRHQLGVLNPLALSYPMLTTLLAVLTRLLFFPR